MSGQTLRGRLALSATATAGAVVLVVTFLFSVLLERRLDAEAENVLRGRADAVAATVGVSPEGRVQHSDINRDEALDTGIWIYQGLKAIERPPGQKLLQQTADGLAGTSGRLVRQVEPPGTLYLSVAVRAHRGGPQVGTIIAAISLDPYQRSARDTLVAALGLCVVLIGFVYLVARSVATSALRPVTEMTRQAGEWSAGDTSLRFGPGRRPGELEELALTLDAVLDRLSAVLRREQHLSAEISHELRTPLAGITAEAELFATRPRTPEQAEQAMGLIREGAGQMERILDTLLASARAEANRSRGRCDAVAVAARLATVETSGALPFVGADEQVVERVLSPLVDNALRYGAVRIRVSAFEGGVRLEVLDDGPGVPAGQEESVFEPGRRLEVADGHDGAGLGLALARRLARSAGGDLTCVAGPGGRFVLTLPRA